ncbi:hypothetical protein [Deinococcus sp. QL22]|uniref:hypothetical protein n=1 Tax=Deinococcus sp. QL22 TaxID=2939437 RepID=UPI002016C91B|nr:hypothetical protein [Deinococcus sp. QL22]UQN09367.1 hypothetical protein M1R55_22670 [Deinococcus sp. QL22]
MASDTPLVLDRIQLHDNNFNEKIEGAIPAQFNQAQQHVAGMMFILARNDLAGTPDGLSEPWPCVEGTEGGVFLPNSFQAYEKFGAGVIRQGYGLNREVPREDGD